MITERMTATRTRRGLSKGKLLSQGRELPWTDPFTHTHCVAVNKPPDKRPIVGVADTYMTWTRSGTMQETWTETWPVVTKSFYGAVTKRASETFQRPAFEYEERD